MKNELPYRSDFKPLCPVHLQPMASEPAETRSFKCSNGDCHIRWQRHDGYFDSNPHNANERRVLTEHIRTAYVIEHGYFYLASVDAQNRKTWLCSVRDCTNQSIDN